MELKTLKDWEIEQDEKDGVVDIEWLRAEAIKWAKNYRRDRILNQLPSAAEPRAKPSGRRKSVSPKRAFGSGSGTPPTRTTF